MTLMEENVWVCLLIVKTQNFLLKNRAFLSITLTEKVATNANSIIPKNLHQKFFVFNAQFLKLMKILAVLIKKCDRKCRLTLPEGKIFKKYMHSFKNYII